MLRFCCPLLLRISRGIHPLLFRLLRCQLSGLFGWVDLRVCATLFARWMRNLEAASALPSLGRARFINSFLSQQVAKRRLGANEYERFMY